MDIGQFIFPFIMAVITNSLMIVAIYFLRKISYFSNLFSVWFMVALYLMCVLRMFLPLEFPGIQVILRDTAVFNTMAEALWTRVPDAASSPSAIVYIFLVVWAVGMIAFGIISLAAHKSRKTYYLANYDFTSDEEKQIFGRVRHEILGDRSHIVIKKTDAVQFIMVIGYFRKYVLLPNKEYDPDELEMIFRHELTHIKNKDLWLKLLVHIYCCFFWWNPFSYLLKHDLDFTLEMRCDLSAARAFTDQQKEQYFAALTANCRQKASDKKDERDYFFICSELSGSRKNKEFVKRTKAIAKDPPNKVGQIAANSAVALVLVAAFAISYFFIWQPFYGPEVDEDDYEISNGYVSDDTNSYLIKRSDGSYLFYFSDYPPMEVSQEEIEGGLFEGYPIYE